MPNWSELLGSGVLDSVDGKASTTRELAKEVEKVVGEPITTDSLFNAHKRHKDRLGLRDSLTDYMQLVEVAPTLGINDIEWLMTGEKVSELQKAKRVVITSAMNNCPVDDKFWASLKRYVRRNKASLIVIPVRYRNPSSQLEAAAIDNGAWWDEKLHDYLTDEQVQLHKNLIVMAQVRINATAVHPTTGLDTMSGGASAIFGHSQMSLRSVPTPQHHIPKALWTSGSCTVPSYSKTKAGIKGESLHSLGAMLVEIDGSRFFARTLEADSDGGFYDLTSYYSPTNIEKSKSVLALITGDEHVMFNDSRNRAACYTNKDSIVNTLKPEKIVRHDVFDGYSISHHNRNDAIIQYSKHKNGHHLVKSELDLTVRHIDSTTPSFAENLIVASNHHDHLLRWLKESHPAQEPWNADTWLEIWGLLKDTIEFKERGVVYDDPFALWMSSRLKSRTVFLKRDEARFIGGIAVDSHGDKGVNGSRGSINQYAKFAVRSIIGHSHQAGRRHNAVQVGTSSTLRMDYTCGPGGWSHTHAVIYPNGAVQLIHVIDGHWRLK